MDYSEIARGQLRRFAKATASCLFSGRLLFCLLAVIGWSHSASAAIAFVQGNFNTPAATQSSVTVTFTGAQTAGNFNVVIIAWNNTTAQLTSLTDTNQNPYVAAIGPTVSPNNETQYIFYAKNIVSAAAGTNTVTAVFSGAVPYPDIRVAEYSGIDTTNPLDGAVGSNGNGATMTTGSLTTTNANDLLVAGNELATTTTAHDSAFTQRMLTSDGSNLEDRIVTSTGTYSATDTQDPGWWVMQMVAFKAAATGGDTQAPSMPTNLQPTVVSSTQVNLSWTASTDNVGVTGYKIERCTGSSCTNFLQIGTSVGTTYSDTTGVASTTYRYQVKATDAATNTSSPSSAVPATTFGGQPPSTPGSLISTAVSQKEIDISWSPSTSPLGIAGYVIERCQGAGCSNFNQVGAQTPNTYLYDAGLTLNTSYSYRVRAVDTSGGQSNNSTVLTVVTLNPPSSCD